MRVLLLDTAFASAPVYDFLVGSGHDVWVMGNRPNDLLARRAESNWIEQDYSKVAAVEDHVARLNIERVVPGCTDVSIETCSQLIVAADLRDSAEINTILGDKREFRAICEQIKLPAPCVFEESAFPLPGQFISKPVDSFSGRGVSVFDGNDSGELHRCIDVARRVSPTSRVIIENFVAGDLYSCSAFVEAQRLTDVFFVREGSSINPFAVDVSYLSWDMPLDVGCILREGLERLCASLSLKDGLLHTQFILSGNQPFVVEVTRRCPGDLYPLVIEYTTGFRYAAKYASYFLGAELRARSKYRRHILRHTVTADEDSYFDGLVFAQSQPVRGYFPIAAMGERLQREQRTRAGILFSESSSYSDLISTYQQFLDRRAYRIPTLSHVADEIAPDRHLPAAGNHTAQGVPGA